MVNRPKCRDIGLFWSVVSLFGVMFVSHAQVAPPGAQRLPATRPAGVAAIPVDANAASTNQMAPELKFEEAPLAMVLKDYGEAMKRTLLFDPKVPAPAKGITLRNEGGLTMEEYLQAIETVLAMNGVGLVKVGDKFLKIVPIEAARQEGMGIRGISESATLKDTDELVSQMIQLKFIDVAEATKLMEALKFHHAYGKIHAFERTNCILLTDTAANVARILEVLKYVDQPIEAREEPKVIAIKYAKASLIKQKLEEIIAESQKDQSTVARLKDRGSPGVVTAPAPTFTPPVTPPGVIRPAVVAPRTPTPDSGGELSTIMDEAERGIIRGKVKIVADDRTNILIIITRPENMQFFEKIIKVLDVPTDPDVMVKVLRLEFADAEQVATMLNTFIGAQQQQKESAKPSSVTASADAAKETRSTALADFAKQQREAIAKVADGEGIKSKMGELAAQNIKILADKRINSLIIMASKLDLATIEEIVKEMDMAVSQVLIEVMILDVSLSDNVQTGVDWIQRSLVAYNKNSDGSRKPIFGFAGTGGGDPKIAGQPIPLSSLTQTFPQVNGLTYYLTYFGLNADLVAKMVSTDSRSRILSSPIILTTDNKKAQLDITKEQYFYKGQNLVSSYTSAGISSQPLANVDTKSVGLKLTVTPHINKNKNVQMEILQEISDANTEQDVPGAGVGGATARWPVMAVKKFEATVSVRSGMTIVLGGLSDNTKSVGNSKIPLLGDIPLLGLLFSSKDVKKSRSEILVFLTPYVMDSNDEIEAEARRRQMAVGDGDDGKWTRGWSDSKLGTPSKSEAKEKARRELELEKNARAAEKQMEAEARAKKVSVKKAESREITELAQQSTNSADSVTGIPASVDPAIESLIRKKEGRLDREIQQIDRRIQREILDQTEKKP